MRRWRSKLIVEVLVTLEHPAYAEHPRRVRSRRPRRCCCATTPGMMTPRSGTNTWVLQGPGQRRDGDRRPRAPTDDEHIEQIAELGRIPLVLISHKHEDHTGGIDKIVDRTGAVVRSVGSGFLRGSRRTADRWRGDRRRGPAHHA